MTDLQTRVRDDLTAALRARDKETVRVLRTVLSAIANAEAQPDADETPVRERSDGAIAGATKGVAASDVPRRELDETEVRAIVAGEQDERLAAADDLTARGAPDAAETLRAGAGVLDRYLS